VDGWFGSGWATCERAGERAAHSAYSTSTRAQHAGQPDLCLISPNDIP
jgi:hypothetical protein